MPKYENIETVIDRFLEYVRNKKWVSLPEASSALAINLSQAERLALLLEQSGFVEMHYGVDGVHISAKKVGEITEKKVEQSRKSAVDKTKEMEREVLTAENLLKFFERDIARRIELADSLLKEIEQQDKLSSGDVQKVEEEVDTALGQLAAFSSEIETLSDMEEKFYERLIEFKKKLHSLKGHKEVKQELSLLNRIIQWLKSLFAKAEAKKEKKQVTRRKKRYGERGVTFLAHGTGFPDAGKQAQIQLAKTSSSKKTPSAKMRYFKNRFKKVKQTNA